MERVDFILSEKDRGGSGSTTFSGRKEGREVRRAHQVDMLDDDKRMYIVKMPNNTSSFNPSFFLGLFFPSIKKLGMEEFKKKYEFCYDNLYDVLKPIIRNNITECFRRANNELMGVTALDDFINGKK